MPENFPAAVGVTTPLCTATEPSHISRRFPRPRLSQPFPSVCHCGAALPFFSSLSLILFTVRALCVQLGIGPLRASKFSSRALRRQLHWIQVRRQFGDLSVLFFLLPFSVFLIPSLYLSPYSLPRSFSLFPPFCLPLSLPSIFLSLPLLYSSFYLPLSPHFIFLFRSLLSSPLSLRSIFLFPFLLSSSFAPLPFLVFLHPPFAPAHLIVVGAR